MRTVSLRDKKAQANLQHLVTRYCAQIVYTLNHQPSVVRETLRMPPFETKKSYLMDDPTDQTTTKPTSVRYMGPCTIHEPTVVTFTPYMVPWSISCPVRTDRVAVIGVFGATPDRTVLMLSHADECVLVVHSSKRDAKLCHQYLPTQWIGQPLTVQLFSYSRVEGPKGVPSSYKNLVFVPSSFRSTNTINLPPDRVHSLVTAPPVMDCHVDRLWSTWMTLPGALCFCSKCLPSTECTCIEWVASVPFDS